MRDGEVVGDEQGPAGRIAATAPSGRGRAMSVVSEIEAETDPRHVFLSAREVMARYGWGQTRGYQNLKDRELVPEPVMKRPDRWRLDQLLEHEDRRIARAQEARKRRASADRGPENGARDRSASLFPQPKQRRRST